MKHSNADLRAIFSEALEYSEPSDLSDYLDAACQGDQEVRAQIVALLKAHREAGGFMGGLKTPEDTAVASQSISERPGMRIGPYKLLQQIGEGGFGVVFMAEQTEPIRRKVALKVIKPGMDTKQVVSRFEAERQALALMDHPNIARVLDAGSTDSGRPYFVMELVRGIPITDYCDRSNLPPRERMELFTSACRALQHAHQKGIVHRDIKPANVLVTLHDGTPMVKVIDFGVSKALDKPLTERTLFTEFGQMVGTPLYMSPEQADLSYLDVDCRADIYALGVLLYELLTGATPFDKERLRQAAYDEIRRIIREEDPPVPSKKISTLGDNLSVVSAHRSTEPRRLSALLRGDLDWIVMKALEKDRTRRYATATDFAADIERHLHDEAVEARPPSAAYRARKFLRRNRSLLVPAGLTLATTLVGILVGLAALRGDRLLSTSSVSAEAEKISSPPPNFSLHVAPADLSFTLKGPRLTRTFPTGRHTLWMPPGTYDLFKAERAVGEILVPALGRKNIGIYSANVKAPENPQVELFGHMAYVICVAYARGASWPTPNPGYRQYRQHDSVVADVRRDLGGVRAAARKCQDNRILTRG